MSICMKSMDSQNLPGIVLSFFPSPAIPDIMALKRMLEKLGAAKTHLELKKMITEVTGGMSETISYMDFVRMMLGKRSAIFKIILMYEEKAKEKDEKPSGPPPKKIIADLP
ncbi:UNVERIFIED_CONTAM: hypothetical protein K2H54_060876 [Gekko kuhli]